MYYIKMIQYIVPTVLIALLIKFFVTRENSKFIAISETGNHDLTLIEEKSIMNKIENNFKKVKEVLGSGTGENNVFGDPMNYPPLECGVGDRDRARDGYCRKADHEDCFKVSGMNRIACGSGMLFHRGRNSCGCMTPRVSAASGAITVNY
tara:strand:- start:1366 stop:1815 length:450 start_codon:yes stop_codon:yes gene_type:complete